MSELDAFKMQVAVEGGNAKDDLVEAARVRIILETLIQKAKEQNKRTIDIQTADGRESVDLSEAQQACDAHADIQKYHEERMGRLYALTRDPERMKRFLAIAHQWKKGK